MSSVAGNADGLPFVGSALSTAERAALQSSLPLLGAKYNTPVHFWGKIFGYKADYLIAQAMPDGIFGQRFSFFSVDGGTSWTLLESITEDQEKFCDELRGVYMGDPNFLYKIRRDIPPEPEPEVPSPEADAVLAEAREKYGEGEEKEAEEEEEEEEEEENEGEKEEEEEEEEDAEELEEAAAPKKKRPKFMIVAAPETVRLAHFIQLHDKACALIVRGQYVFTPGGGVAKNELFAGQPVRHAMKPSCYMRVYHSADVNRNRLLYGPTYSEVTDRLSPITDDAPNGVWVVKYDPTASIVTVQNLFYAGSLFWYRPGTADCGQVYCGNGERDVEVCFLL